MLNFQLDILRGFCTLGILSCYVSAQSNIPAFNSESKTNLVLCSPQDVLSKQYCQCDQNVVSCDFSKFKPQSPTLLELDSQQIQSSVKRMCICGTPSNLQLLLSGKFSPRHAELHRIDLYRLDGILNLLHAFSSFSFGGDIYMANVKYWREIYHQEFSRRDLIVQNVERFKCCSKISTPEYGRPTLYIENTTVGFIKSHGLTDDHLWKAVIMNGVSIKGAEKFGIVTSDPNLDFSMTNCLFNNMTEEAISINDASNVVVAKSIFNHTCHRLAFQARSGTKDSALAVIGNSFLNDMVWRMDATNVMNWFNLYDFWHSSTFFDLHQTKQEDRTFSIEYNRVQTYLMKSQDIQQLQPGNNVVFNENILSACFCSTLLKNLSVPALLSRYTSRCDSNREPNKNNCLITIDAARQTCKNAGNRGVEFEKMCQNKAVSMKAITLNSNPKDLKLKAAGIRITSPFIPAVLRSIGVPFYMHTSLKPQPRSNNGRMIIPLPLLILFLTILH